MSERLWLLGLLVLLGAGWGATQPFAKIAVSEGYRHFGLIFWQLVIGAMFLGAILTVRGRPLRVSKAALGFAALIALVGTIVPNSASYEAARHLPAGILSIVISLVPMFAFPIALLLGTDRFSVARLSGLLCGLAGVALLIGPEASLPDRAAVIFVFLAMLGPLCYALEGNIVSRWGTGGLDPVELLFAASVVGAGLALPLALGTGQFIDPRPPWGAPDVALVASSLIHAAVYAAYVWLVGRAGAVFAAQVSYLVTGFGVLWSILFLGEAYAGWVWLALALMFMGLFLVQPRPKSLVDPAGGAAKDTP